MTDKAENTAPPVEEQVESKREDLPLDEALSDAFDEMAAAEDETEEVEETEEVTEGEDEVVAESESEDEEAPEWDEPAPDRWPDEIKEVYNGLPVEARKAMLEGVFKPMQRAYTQSTQELSQMRQQVQPMLETLGEYKNTLERQGMSPVEAFRRQMAWAAHIGQVGPEQGLRDMAASYGLNQEQEAGQEEQYLTPVERSLKQRLDAMEGQIGQQAHMQQHQAQASQQAFLQQRYNEVQGGLQEFMNEQKDGKPAHPHLEKVAPAVAGLIRGGLIQQTDDYGQPVPIRNQLAQAYSMACDMDPSIRSARPGGQVANAAAAQKAEVVTKLPASQVDIEELSMEESLNKLYDEMNRRAG
jgi:hypothetical protein